MGYEIKMMVGKRTSIVFKNKVYFMVYADVDLCKLGYDTPLSEFISQKFMEAKNRKETVYIYGLDGNKEVTKDKYGEKLAIADIQKVYKVMSKEKEAKIYRRLKWALHLLKAMKDDSEGLEVLFFGY